MGGGVVAERDDPGMAIEYLLDHAALDPPAATVHQPDLGQAGVGGRGDELPDHRRDVTGREGVQVEFAVDRHTVHPVVGQIASHRHSRPAVGPA